MADHQIFEVVLTDEEKAELMGLVEKANKRVQSDRFKSMYHKTTWAALTDHLRRDLAEPKTE